MTDAEDLVDMIHARVLSKQVLESERFTYSPSYDTGILGKGKLPAEEFGELMNRKVRLASHVVESIPNYFINLRKLRDIRERLDDIAKEMGEFQLKEVLMSRLPQTGNREGRETGPHIVESEVCGRKEDVEKVIGVYTILHLSTQNKRNPSTMQTLKKSQQVKYICKLLLILTVKLLEVSYILLIS